LSPAANDALMQQLSRQLLTATACKVTKKLHLLPYKIKQFQAVESDYKRRMHFCNCFCRQYMMVRGMQ
jgi:hypothetical protein